MLAGTGENQAGNLKPRRKQNFGRLPGIPDTFSCGTPPRRRYLDASKSAGQADFQNFHHERNGSHNDQCAGGW
jgi:hypothetical protein